MTTSHVLSLSDDSHKHGHTISHISWHECRIIIRIRADCMVVHSAGGCMVVLGCSRLSVAMHSAQQCCTLPIKTWWTDQMCQHALHDVYASTLPLMESGVDGCRWWSDVDTFLTILHHFKLIRLVETKHLRASCDDASPNGALYTHLSNSYESPYPSLSLPAMVGDG